MSELSIIFIILIREWNKRFHCAAYCYWLNREHYLECIRRRRIKDTIRLNSQKHFWEDSDLHFRYIFSVVKLCKAQLISSLVYLTFTLGLQNFSPSVLEPRLIEVFWQGAAAGRKRLEISMPSKDRALCCIVLESASYIMPSFEKGRYNPRLWILRCWSEVTVCFDLLFKYICLNVITNRGQLTPVSTA